MKIGEFKLNKIDEGFWYSGNPFEDREQDMSPYCSIERDEKGTWTVQIMGGPWCETCYYIYHGSFRLVVNKARQFLQEIPFSFVQKKVDNCLPNI